MTKEQELKILDGSHRKFKSAYKIEGRGVGKLELDRALESAEFRKATKELVKRIHAAYPNLKEAKTTD